MCVWSDLIWYTTLFLAHKLLRIYKLYSALLDKWQMKNNKYCWKFTNFTLSLSFVRVSHTKEIVFVFYSLCVYTKRKWKGSVERGTEKLLQINENAKKKVNFNNKIDNERVRGREKRKSCEWNDLIREVTHIWFRTYTIHTIKLNWKLNMSRLISQSFSLSHFLYEIRSVTSIINYTPVCTQFFPFLQCVLLLDWITFFLLLLCIKMRNGFVRSVEN